MNFRALYGQFIMKYMAGNRNPKVIENKIHIACVGDSITFGHGVKGKSELTWPYYLNKIIGDDYQVINFGVSGRTLLSNGDYPYTKDRIYQRSLDCKASIYLIMLGTNDAKPFNYKADKFKKEYEDFIRQYIDLENKPRVILLSPTSCFKAAESGVINFGINKDNLKQIVETIKEISLSCDLKYIDLYQYTEAHPEWFVDGVHPNKEGNQAIADYLATKLNNEYQKESI